MTSKERTVSSPRRVDVTLEIKAPIEDVWSALSMASELTNWLPTDAVIDGVPGGRYTISWDGGWEWDTRIEIWDPPLRLRLIDRQARPFDTAGRPIGDVAQVELALEYTLEARGGTTILRLVHSGFGQGASWDDEVDGVSLGWASELRGLRHYLEHHRGRRRTLGWARASRDEATDAIWPGLFGGQGLVTRGPSDARIGDVIRLDLSTGDVIEGPVLFTAPNRQLLVRAENLHDSLFRLATDRAGGRSLLQVTLASWTLDPAAVHGFAARVQSVL